MFSQDARPTLGMPRPGGPSEPITRRVAFRCASPRGRARASFAPVRPPAEAEISAPEFPPRLDWLGVPFLRMDRLLGQHAVLVEFWDFARVHSLRTLPYLRAWHERYAGAGLQVIGVHSPGYSFGRDREAVERAVERLALPYPVVLDPDLAVWRLYGNRGWPGRYLFDRRSLLRFLHYGEGEYLETELAIQECLLRDRPRAGASGAARPAAPRGRARRAARAPDRGHRASRRPRPPGAGARLGDGEDWLEAADAGAAASFSFSAGGAFAVLSGDDVEPGLYETDGTVTAEAPGLRLHGVQFTPAPPAPSGSPGGA